MSVYMTEEEQLESIKKWWQKYSQVITIALSVALLCFAAYRYWNWHLEKVNRHASSLYEQMMVAFSNQDHPGVKSYANQLVKEYDRTIYSDAAHLTLAKILVSENQYTKAQSHLEAVVQQSKMPALRQVATIRSVRLLVLEKAYGPALSQLNVVSDSAYLPVVHELKGDIYALTGEYPKAVASYREAMSEARTQGIGTVFLEMKTNELAAFTHSLHESEKQSKIV